MASKNDADPRPKRRRRRGGLASALRWLAFMPLASRVPMYSRLIWALLLDSRIPMSRKAVLGVAAGYVALGRDLIPEDIPVLGGLDDLAVVVLAVEVFFDSIPQDILEEKLAELEIDREAFQSDIDLMRRITPAPVRRIIRQLPDAFESAGRLVAKSELGPKIRSFINREESIA